MYGVEAMYNINQKEMRKLEQIEEDQMRKKFQVKTGIQVPIHIMYLDLGQVPARYQVMRYKVNFLQYLLHQHHKWIKWIIRRNAISFEEMER